VPAQILAKLKKANYLFLGYPMTDWRLRVFLKRIWRGPTFGRGKSWAIQSRPDQFERELCQRAGVTLYVSTLPGYVETLERLLSAATEQRAAGPHA
jgi:hypothetical protein